MASTRALAQAMMKVFETRAPRHGIGEAEREREKTNKRARLKRNRYHYMLLDPGPSPVCWRVCVHAGGLLTLWQHAVCGSRWALKPSPPSGLVGGQSPSSVSARISAADTRKLARAPRSVGQDVRTVFWQ